MRHLRHPGTNRHVGMRQLTALDAAEEVAHMVVEPFALALLERNRLHARGVIRHLREHLPAGSVEHHRALLSEESQSLLAVVEAVVDATSMIPNDVEIFIGIGSHQGIGCLHGIIGVGQFAASRTNTSRQVCPHALQGVIQQVHAPIRHQASGIVPEETEVVVETVRVERTLRSRA